MTLAFKRTANARARGTRGRALARECAERAGVQLTRPVRRGRLELTRKNRNYRGARRTEPKRRSEAHRYDHTALVQKHFGQSLLDKHQRQDKAVDVDLFLFGGLLEILAES